jgi:hypothetical protein
MKEYLSLDIIKSLFLLVLVISGNYIGELLGCRMKNVLHNNIYVKQITLFLLIYFTIGLVGDKSKHPIDVFKDTAILYVLYIILTKTHLYFTVIILFLIFSLYIIDELENYNNDNKINYDKEMYNNYKMNIMEISIIVIIAAFSHYLYSKKMEYKNKFNIITFLLGNTTCKNN